MGMKSKWFIVHVYSGSENRVCQMLSERAEKKGLSSYIEEVLVPTEEVVEIKGGERVFSEKKCFPGYILLKIVPNDDLWYLIRGIPRVSGVLGNKGQPIPVSEAEVERIMSQVQETRERPREAFVFEVGDNVRVNDGPFASFTGVVEEVETEKQRLKVSVMIFGRSTPVDLDYVQVDKI